MSRESTTPLGRVCEFCDGSGFGADGALCRWCGGAGVLIDWRRVR